MSTNTKAGREFATGTGTSVESTNIRRIQWQNELIQKDVWQCCLNCCEWSNGMHGTPMGCKLHKAMPPVEVVVVGCKDHMCDIPF